MLLAIYELVIMPKLWTLPFFCYPDLPIRFLFCPFLFFYTAKYLNPDYKASGKRLLFLFLPAILELIVFIISCIYFSNNTVPFKERFNIANGLFFTLRTSLAIIFNLWVTFLILKKITNFERGIKLISNERRKLNFRWLKSITIISIILWVSWLSLFLMEVLYGGSSWGFLYFPLYFALAIIILCFGYFAIFVPYLPSEYISTQEAIEVYKSNKNHLFENGIIEGINFPDTVDTARPKNIYNPSEDISSPILELGDKIDNEFTLKLFCEIEELLQTEKLYQSYNLNLQLLSTKLNTTSANISQAIKLHSKEGSFYSYINSLRFKHFMELAKNTDNDIFTLETLANRSGFSSKTTFNKYCNELTGKSPSKIKIMLQEGYTFEQILISVA